MSKKQFIAFIMLCLLLCCLPVNAEADNEMGAPFIKNYLPEEYKANPQNWWAVQDSRGVMYFGNTYGILVYYGKHWELIKVTNKSRVTSLAIDDTDRVYVGAMNELGYLAYDSGGKLIYVSLLNLLPEKHRKFATVWATQAGRDGIYFSNNRKIFYYNENKIEVLDIDSNYQSLFSVYGKVINTRKDKGLFLLDKGKSRLLPYCENFSKAKSGTICIMPYLDNKILICTEKEGIFVYDLEWLFQEKSVPPSIPEKFPNEINEYLIENPYLRTVKIDDGHYAFKNSRKGIAIMDHQGKLIREVNKNHGLTTNEAFNIISDRAGNLWVMLNKGLSYVEIGSPISRFSESMGIEGAVISMIRHAGQLYAGTYTGVFYLAENRNSNSSKNKFFPVKIAREQCFDFFSRGSTLLAAGEGVFHIRGNSGKKIITSGAVLSFGSSKKFPDHVFCGSSPGFFVLKIEQPGNNSRTGDTLGTTYIPPGKFADLKKDIIHHMIADKNGDLWLSLRGGGINHLQFTGLEVTDYKITCYDQSQGLPQGGSNYIQFLNDQLVVFNNEGIYKPVLSGPGSNPSITRFEKVSSFPGLIVDPSISFNRDQIDKNKKVFVYSDTVFGILTHSRDGEFLWNPIPFKKVKGFLSYFLDRDSVLWMGSYNGLFRYDPALKKDYQMDYPALIKKVIINNRRAIFNGTYYDPGTKKGDIFFGRLDTQPPEMVHTLEYKDNSITFQYSALFYEKESANRYSYILEGYKDEWSQWTTETKAVYTNLPEGNYCFKVKARNVFQHESARVDYKFIISPPWTRTIYAYAGYVAVLILLFYVGIRLYSRRLIAAKHRLEKIVSQRTAETKKQAEKLRIQNAEINEQAGKLKIQNAEINKQAKALEVRNLELQKQREAAEAANYSKSIFLARMSHEIRTPINSVIGFAEMLMDTELNEEQSDYSQTIARSGEVLLSLVNDILDFSKIEAGKLTFENIDFDLEVMAFDICHLVLPRVGDKPVEVICSIGDEVPAYVLGDPGRLRQVLGNLMVNAAKFTDKGEIHLSINIEEETDHDLLIHARVRDTGIGIPKDKLAVIFDDFLQVDGSTTRKYGGTGLGLAICKQIAQLMKGSLWVESEPGKGSTFHFTARVQKSRKKMLGKPPLQPLSGKKVLIADDNITNLEILVHNLESMDMRPIALNHSKEVMPAIISALEQEAPFDICILDIQMPGISGYELAQQIRSYPDARVSGLPLLAFSSSTGKNAHLFMESGFNAYLPKPISRYKLKKMIERLLGLEAAEPGAAVNKRELLTRFSLVEEEKHSVCILLAEDNPINRKLAKMMLTKAGYRLETANNGREAVDMFMAEPGKFNLILMDVNMPEMDGLQAVKELREKGFNIPIIAVTADAMKEDREKCLEAGMNDYITKPIRREIVFQMVKKWSNSS